MPKLIITVKRYSQFFNGVQRRYTRRAADGKFGVINKFSTVSNRPLKKYMTFDAF